MPFGSSQYFDLEKISQALFEQPTQEKVLAAYQLAGAPESAAELRHALCTAFGQASIPAEKRDLPDNAIVFKAAASAIASSGRDWSVFLKRRGRFNDLLDGGPAAVAERSSNALQNELAACLPGRRSTRDALAILQWAAALQSASDFGAGLEAARLEIRRLLGPNARAELDLPCMAVLLSGPPASWPPATALARLAGHWSALQWKAPGMGLAIAAEFLRNLHWPGFKPDRHIVRLLSRWVPERVEQNHAQARTIAGQLDRYSKDVIEYLQISLTAIELTPPGEDPNHVDNMIWALGAMVEEEGKESDRTYLTGGK